MSRADVDARIKLRFRDVTGRTMDATRVVRCTQKTKRTEMKTLEGSIVSTDPTTGEVRAL